VLVVLHYDAVKILPEKTSFTYTAVAVLLLKNIWSGAQAQEVGGVSPGILI